MREHYITEAQIDEAVEMANSHLYSVLSSRSMELGEYMWAILNKLNIERCEKYIAHNTDMGIQNPCPKCNGHGWVIGGNDDHHG